LAPNITLMAIKKPTTIDEYIAGFPEETQRMLEQARGTIKGAVPRAEEKISYGIPCITLNGKYVLYFAGYKKHIGVYPVPRKGFEKDFAPYKTSGKGTIQFPLDESLPLTLIKKITKFQVQQNLAKEKSKPVKKSKAPAKKRK
jgi:uncharacterized protein YdhG (YjbR/CyaY superfamily)